MFALIFLSLISLASAMPNRPNWTPTWNLSRSTAVMPCNDSGFVEPLDFFAQFGEPFVSRYGRSFILSFTHSLLSLLSLLSFFFLSILSSCPGLVDFDWVSIILFTHAIFFLVLALFFT